jgi:hypothetical protein
MNRTMRMRAGSLVSAMTREPSAARTYPGHVAERLAAEFARLAGAHEKALALIHALRNGELAPTGPMGWMDVKISLVLVQDSLLHAGSANPSAEALDAALKGVLGMRAGGMGWGRIAFMTAGANRPGKAIGKDKAEPGS